MAGTNGKFESMTRNVITGEMYHIKQVGIKWFIWGDD